MDAVRSGALGMLLIASSGSLLAQEEDWRERCKAVSTLAATVMEARQSGVSLSDVMDGVESGGLSEQMAMEAYDRPRFSTPEMQEETINEFGNNWYLRCAKALRGQSEGEAENP